MYVGVQQYILYEVRTCAAIYTVCTYISSLYTQVMHIRMYVLIYTGGRVVYSEGRLIPHEFPITDSQQITGPDGVRRITCTVSSGTARFIRDGGEVEREGQLETAITVKGDIQNRAIYCNSNDTNYFYLYLRSSASSE